MTNLPNSKIKLLMIVWICDINNYWYNVYTYTEIAVAKLHQSLSMVQDLGPYKVILRFVHLCGGNFREEGILSNLKNWSERNVLKAYTLNEKLLLRCPEAMGFYGINKIHTAYFLTSHSPYIRFAKLILTFILIYLVI